MPSKNIVKHYATHTYFHIYNRGVEKRDIFIDEQDFAVFLGYLKRHLGSEAIVKKPSGYLYPNYHNDLTLLAFCLMSNHFHLLLYQKEDLSAITKLLRSVCTSYTMYFNKKYKRVGHLFQERYKASSISSDAYVQHISRYIHLNPSNYKTYKWSSLPYFKGLSHADWINPEPILEMFKNREEYFDFVQDYEAQKEILEELKYELAST
jgi:putative transposase